MIHDLKTWAEPFNLVLGGRKAFELRRDDRGFEVGHDLQLREWDPYAKAYTGRELTRRITCIVRAAGPVALPEGLVVLGMEDMAPVDERARLCALLHTLAELLGVPSVVDAIEEETILAAARAVKTKREDALRMLAACGEEA